MLFDLQQRTVGDWAVVSVVGDVDLSSLPRLTAAIERLDGCSTAVDLTSVDFFDPVCLGALVAADLRQRRRDGTFVVVAAGAVAALLGESGLDRMLRVVGELPDS